MLKIETLPKMLLHLIHKSENFSSQKKNSERSINWTTLRGTTKLIPFSRGFFNLELPQNPKVVIFRN